MNNGMEPFELEKQTIKSQYCHFSLVINDNLTSAKIVSSFPRDVDRSRNLNLKLAFVIASCTTEKFLSLLVHSAVQQRDVSATTYTPANVS